MAPIDKVLNALRTTTGQEPKRSGSGWSGLCPVHDDHNPSLSINEGDDGKALVTCMARNCDFADIAAALGLTKQDFFPDNAALPSSQVNQNSKPQARPKRKSPVKTFPTSKAAIEALEAQHGKKSAGWTYRDSAWNVVGCVVRWDKPGGKEIRPIASTRDGWIIGAMPEPRPLYQLKDVLQSERSAVVFVVEGEKAADAANALGLLATTSAGGCKAASKSDWTPLAGRSVVIIPDNDEPGRKYAQQVAGIVTKLDPPATVRIINLADDWPELPDAGDIADWYDGHDAVEPETLRARLDGLIEQTEEWKPTNGTQGDVPSKSLTRSVVLQSFADVVPQQLRWLWPGRLPLGMLSLVSGNPAVGKSFLMADMIARVTRGLPWPDAGESNELKPPGDVILINAEDAVSACQRPRLDAAGADASRVHRIEAIEQRTAAATVERRPFNIIHAAGDLRDAAKQLPNLRLIVLDPLAAFLAGVRSNDQGEIRNALSPLVELAEELDVAIVFVHHNRKGTGSHSSERLSGSLQIGATMRQVWEVFADPEDKDRRLFVAGKNSNARERGGLAFRIVDSTIKQSEAGEFVGRVEWDANPLNLSADDIAFQSLDSESRDPWPVDWLRDFLMNGARLARDVHHAAKQEGLTEKQLRTARKRLGIKPTKTGFIGGWGWPVPTR